MRSGSSGLNCEVRQAQSRDGGEVQLTSDLSPLHHTTTLISPVSQFIHHRIYTVV